MRRWTPQKLKRARQLVFFLCGRGLVYPFFRKEGSRFHALSSIVSKIKAYTSPFLATQSYYPIGIWEKNSRTTLVQKGFDFPTNILHWWVLQTIDGRSWQKLVLMYKSFVVTRWDPLIELWTAPSIDRIEVFDRTGPPNSSPPRICTSHKFCPYNLLGGLVLVVQTSGPAGQK
jgi:hypothetical protein